MRQDIAMGKGLVGRSKRVLAKWTTNGHINEEGVKELLLRLSTYEEDKKKKPYKEVDRQDFVKDLRKTIEEAGIERFTAFVRSEFDSLYKDRYLWDNGKKYAFNIDNSVWKILQTTSPTGAPSTRRASAASEIATRATFSRAGSGPIAIASVERITT